jgi:hypothetical protein
MARPTDEYGALLTEHCNVKKAARLGVNSCDPRKHFKNTKMLSSELSWQEKPVTTSLKPLQEQIQAIR